MLQELQAFGQGFRLANWITGRVLCIGRRQEKGERPGNEFVTAVPRVRYKKYIEKEKIITNGTQDENPDSL